MAQRQIVPLTNEEKAKVQQRIIEIRKELGFTVGDVIDYDIINKAHQWCISRFRYRSDDTVYEYTDFWNPLAFDWLILDGYLEDDCDGYGYSIIGFLHRVLLVKDSDLFRVSCSTETNEGHFVCWVKTDDGIFYQVENRVRKPRTIKYMRELGYTYWHYSDFTPKNIKPDRWFNAEKRASEIIYHTPVGLASDEPEVTTSKLISKVPESKTLQLGTGVGVSTVIGVISALANSTADWRAILSIGLLGLITAGAIFYIRGKTYTSLDTKGSRLVDSEGFIA